MNNEDQKSKADNLKAHGKQTPGTVSSDKKLETTDAAERVKDGAKDRATEGARKLKDTDNEDDE